MTRAQELAALILENCPMIAIGICDLEPENLAKIAVEAQRLLRAKTANGILGSHGKHNLHS